MHKALPPVEVARRGQKMHTREEHEMRTGQTPHPCCMCSRACTCAPSKRMGSRETMGVLCMAAGAPHLKQRHALRRASPRRGAAGHRQRRHRPLNARKTLAPARADACSLRRHPSRAASAWWRTTLVAHEDNQAIWTYTATSLNSTCTPGAHTQCGCVLRHRFVLHTSQKLEPIKRPFLGPPVLCHPQSCRPGPVA